MTVQLTTEQVWAAIGKELFAVLGMATAQGEARTVGIVYSVHARRLYIATEKDTWKARHVLSNPHVSMTIPIARRVPFMPWMKIPAATITFPGMARVLEVAETPEEVLRGVLRGLASDAETRARMAIIEVTPEREFVTYGVGVSLLDMRFPEKARGRAAVTS